MSKFAKTLKFIGSRPEIVIEVILAIVLLVFAVYLGGPWYLSDPSTSIGSAIESDSVRALTAFVYAIPSVSVLAGVRNKHARVYGTFGLFMAYLFSTILRLLTVGVTPMFWLFLLALSLVAAVVYIVEARHEE
jgi:hypothetical protein